MEFLIGYVESPMDTLLHHQSRQLFRAVATALNRGMPFDGDPRKSLWEKLALEVAQEHCVKSFFRTQKRCDADGKTIPIPSGHRRTRDY